MKHACTQTSSRYSTYHPMHPVKNFSRPSGSLLRNLNQVTIVQVPYHLVFIYIYIYIHVKAAERLDRATGAHAQIKKCTMQAL